MNEPTAGGGAGYTCGFKVVPTRLVSSPKGGGVRHQQRPSRCPGTDVGPAGPFLPDAWPPPVRRGPRTDPESPRSLGSSRSRSQESKKIQELLQSGEEQSNVTANATRGSEEGPFILSRFLGKRVCHLGTRSVKSVFAGSVEAM